MSFLTPLFAAGLVAVSLPVIFHLIRRTPRGRLPFSSLMFLAPSPPRITRRSRLDNLLLLLLRGMALTLLVLAFARPFLRDATNLILDRASSRRVAILLDSSASMRRGDLWTQAVAQVQRAVEQLEPGDDVALFTFAERLRPVVDFAASSVAERDSAATLVRQRVRELEPSWEHTDIGAALVSLADTLATENDIRDSRASLQIVLITDLQQGARIEALQAYEWPDDVQLDIQRVALKTTTNAYLQLLDDDELEGRDEARVRLSNTADSVLDQFYVGWSTAESRDTTGHSVAAYVPPGESRVIRVPRSAELLAADRLVLRGDESPFDNTYYAVPLRRDHMRLVYVGDEGEDDPEGLLYYLARAPLDNLQRTVEVAVRRGSEPLRLQDPALAQIVVVGQPMSPGQRDELQEFLQQGGMVLAVLRTQPTAVSFATMVDQVDVESATDGRAPTDYVMLSEVDFSHPLFAELSGAQYSDFTKIHFWSYQPIAFRPGSSARILARFSDGHPAICEQRVGNGKLFVLTSGWHPADSQLARSSKFVPLVSALLEHSLGGEQELPRYFVKQQVPLPPVVSADTGVSLQMPDGTAVQLASGATVFDGTDQPGIYQMHSGDRSFRFAVNIAAAESDTTPMAAEQLEQYGVRLGNRPSRSEELARERHLRDVELEGRQKLWRWFLFAAIGVLLLETWLAGKKSRIVAAETATS